MNFGGGLLGTILLIAIIVYFVRVQREPISRPVASQFRDGPLVVSAVSLRPSLFRS
jgi:hypothetical protein